LKCSFSKERKNEIKHVFCVKKYTIFVCLFKALSKGFFEDFRSVFWKRAKPADVKQAFSQAFLKQAFFRKCCLA